MYKIINIVLILLIATISLGVYNNISSIDKGVEEEINREVTPDEIHDSLILTSMQINEMASSYGSSYLNDLTVGLNSDDKLEFSFLMDDQFFSLLQLEEISLFEMFEDQKVNCILSINDTFELEKCSVGGLEIPSQLYSNRLLDLNDQVNQFLENYGIEEISVSSQSLEIKGDIENVVKELAK